MFYFSKARRCNILVLSRQKGESIIINDDITIVVVDIRGDKVRIGVDAPTEVPVHRSEIYEKIQGEGAQRPMSSPSPSRKEIQKHVDAQKANKKTI